ncbi:hypothetical protein DIE21_15535 [Burkholderia sp. Bp9140]|nr:hypothetical protein DIE21_15535 [Burkholderia sp. Bp9140]
MFTAFLAFLDGANHVRCSV